LSGWLLPLLKCNFRIDILGDADPTVAGCLAGRIATAS
jgi:hypothetical protein